MGVTLQRTYVSAANALLEQHLQEVSLLARSIDNELSSLARVADDTARFLAIHDDLQEDEIYALLRGNVGSTPLIHGAAVAFEPYQFKEQQRLRLLASVG